MLELEWDSKVNKHVSILIQMQHLSSDLAVKIPKIFTFSAKLEFKIQE